MGLFFSLVQDDVLEQVGFAKFGSLSGPTMLYLDDGTFGGTLDELNVMIRELEPAAAAAGLIINAKKTVIACHSSATLPDGLARFERKHYSDVSLLGVPIGKPADAVKIVEAALVKWRKRVDLIVRTATVDPHPSLAMLRFSGSSSALMSLMRGCGTLGELWPAVDEYMADSLQRIINANSLSEAAIDQALAPTRFSGLGIIRCARHAPLANASAIACAIDSLSADDLITKPWAHDLFTEVATHAISSAPPETTKAIVRFWHDSCAAHASGNRVLDSSLRTVLVDAADAPDQQCGDASPAILDAGADDLSDADDIDLATAAAIDTAAVPNISTNNNNNNNNNNANAAPDNTVPTSAILSAAGDSSSLSFHAETGTPASTATGGDAQLPDGPRQQPTTSRLQKPKSPPAAKKPTAPSFKMQHQLSALIESIAFKRRIAAADEFASKRGSGRPHPRYDSTRLHALTAKNVSLWLYGSCFTTAPRLWLSGKLFCTAIRIRLGIAVGHDDHTCAICNKIGVSDGFGMHSLSCLSGGGKTLIHTRVLDEFQQLASSVAAVPSRENHALPLDPNLRLDLALTLLQEARAISARPSSELDAVIATSLVVSVHSAAAVRPGPRRSYIECGTGIHHGDVPGDTVVRNFVGMA